MSKENKSDIEVNQKKYSKHWPITKSEIFNKEASKDVRVLSKTNDKEEYDTHKDKILENWETSMRKRRAFEYGYLSILHYIFWWVILRRKNSLRGKHKFRNHLYYEIGEEKLQDELDWVSIIKSIRKLKILTHVLLNRQQKFLIKFQRDYVVDSSSSGTSDENTKNIIDLMKSK